MINETNREDCRIKIVADSSCDILSLEGVNFEAAPLTISTDERTYVDNADCNIEEMIDYISSYSGRSYTACPSIDEWLRCYDGADIIYVVTITSGLSGTYNAALSAGNIYKESHPNAKIHVFDSLSTGPEILLCLEKIAEQVKRGLPFDEVRNIVIEYMKHTRLFFSLESLHNFVQNGRVSKLVATAVGVLGLRILGTASEKGELEPVAKPRGDQKMLTAMLHQLEKSGYVGGKVNISHVDNLPFAQKIRDALKVKYPQAAIKIYSARGLCSYYAEKHGILLGCEVQ